MIASPEYIYIDRRRSPEEVEGLEEDGAEAADVEADVLLPEVDVLDERPALLVDGERVEEHRVRPRVHLRQRALLRRDVVLQVPHVHVARRHAVLVHGEPLHPPQRHHLDHHRVHGEEHQVGQPRPVHRHHRVVRVHRRRRRRDVGVQLRRRHLEPDPLRRRHDLVQVHEPAAGAPVDHQQPRLLALVLLLHPDRVLPRQRVPPHQEPLEVHHGVVVRSSPRVDAEVLVAVEPDGGAAVAADALLGVEVDGLVLGQALHDLPVLAEPPPLLLRHQQLDLAGEVARRDEQRDDVVVEVVVVVAAVAAVGVHDRRDVVPLVARRRLVGGHQPHRHLRDAGHHAGLALAGVRLDLPPRRVRVHARRVHAAAAAGDGGEARRHQEHLRRAAEDADGALHLAHVGSIVSEVASQVRLRDELICIKNFIEQIKTKSESFLQDKLRINKVRN
ncbi:hypothetical protein EE612_036392 [Oryza sativa]|nr:hypothetical protein EE612_036392 [Oryza sativa]